MQHLNHPEVHAPSSQWSEDQTLHIAIAYSNPFRWNTRRQLANNCIWHLRNSLNTRVYVGELAYGDRPFEITSPDNPLDIQLRVDRNELFSKENIQNVVIRHFPQNYKYGAAIDADWHFTRHDWALETIQQLQHYKVVQMFSSYADLSGNNYGQAHIPVRYNSSFFFNYHQNGYKVSPQYHNGTVTQTADGKLTFNKAGIAAYAAALKTEAEGPAGNSFFMRGVGATGGAYAWRQSAFDAFGGFLDKCPLGHSDWYFAYSLLDIEPPDIHSQNYHTHYKHYVTSFRERTRSLLKNVGYVDCHCLHYWHGSKSRRAYSTRDIILAKNQFSPYEDLYQNHQGIYQLNPNKTGLRDDIRAYFISRSEDDPTLSGSDKLLI